MNTSHSEQGTGNRYWAVTGRIPGDEEDSILIFHVPDRKAAISAFEQEMWDAEVQRHRMSEQQAALARKALLLQHDQVVFINSVCVSDTPIEEA
ncbi:MAG: hypothetical protein KGZ70_13590 [Hydrogenophaga sp.]|nr:hypothetical protein [Hydrogenophaga sp.]